MPELILKHGGKGSAETVIAYSRISRMTRDSVFNSAGQHTHDVVTITVEIDDQEAVLARREAEILQGQPRPPRGGSGVVRMPTT